MPAGSTVESRLRRAIILTNPQKASEALQYWDNQAVVFDHEPDHGLRDPVVYKAWTDLLTNWLPARCAEILDIGCGTGSLSVLLAAQGHTVTGIDFSPAMIAQAETKAKAAGQSITFKVMDGADPQFAPQGFDVILCRHLLWALPKPDRVLRRWTNLLRPGGRLLLIEGYWHTGGGLHAQEIVAMLPAALINVKIQPLSDRPEFWGGAVTDERYVIIADLPANALSDLL